MTANDSVPTHYQQPYVHWDYAWNARLAYFEGNMTKYITRWRSKDGVKDLKKGVHYAEKLLELIGVGGHRSYLLYDGHLRTIRSETESFLMRNGIVGLEAAAFRAVACWETYEDLVRAIGLTRELLDLAIITAGSVPLTEENHHAPRVGSIDESKT